MILPGAGWFADWGNCRIAAAAMSSCTANGNAVELVSKQQDIRQLVGQYKIQNQISRLCVAPAVLLTVGHSQAVLLCNGLESLVMIGVVSADVFDLMDVGIVVAKLVTHGSTDHFNRPCQRPGRNVQLMGRSGLGNPSIRSEGKMSIGLGTGLNRDGGAFQFSIKELGVHQVEYLIEILGNPVIGGKLLHDDSSL